MQFFLSLVIAFYGVLGAVSEHDIHVSITDVEISTDGKIEVVIKVFLDDLMQSMGLQLGAELPDDYTSSDDLIDKFLQNSLVVKVNGLAIDYELDDTTPSSPALWITLIAETQEEIKTIEIDNRILIDHFDDQSNMINVSYEGERYSELLNRDNTTYVLTVGE